MFFTWPLSQGFKNLTSQATSLPGTEWCTDCKHYELILQAERLKAAKAQRQENIRKRLEFLRGFIPVVGPGCEAWEQYQEGNISQAALHAILAGVDGVGVSCLAKGGLRLVWIGGKQVLKEVAVREIVHQGERQALKLGAEAGSKVMTEVGLLPQFHSVESIINFSTFEQLSKSNPALQAFIRSNTSVEGLANLSAILSLSSGMGMAPLIEGVGTGVGVNNALQSAAQNGLATTSEGVHQGSQVGAEAGSKVVTEVGKEGLKFLSELGLKNEMKVSSSRALELGE